MLDIISIAILLYILICLPILFIIIGGNKKTEEEQKIEDEEQIKYLREYQKNKMNKKTKTEVKMKNKLYTWEQVISYSIIALHSLLNSANDVNLKNMKMFIEPLQELHTKEEAVKYARKLLNKEKFIN